MCVFTAIYLAFKPVLCFLRLKFDFGFWFGLKIGFSFTVSIDFDQKGLLVYLQN